MQMWVCISMRPYYVTVHRVSMKLPKSWTSSHSTIYRSSILILKTSLSILNILVPLWHWELSDLQFKSVQTIPILYGSLVEVRFHPRSWTLNRPVYSGYRVHSRWFHTRSKYRFETESVTVVCEVQLRKRKERINNSITSFGRVLFGTGKRLMF